MGHARAVRYGAGAGALLLTGALSLGTAGAVAGATGTTTGAPAAHATATGVGGGAFTGPTAAGTTPGAATTAAGGTTRTLTRTKLEKALSDRQQLLAKLTTSVQNSGMVSGTEQSALLSQLTAQTKGIDVLAAEVPTAPATQLAGIASTMVHQYRVYRVMAPKVHIAERTDCQGDAESKVTAREPAIEQRIQNAQQHGRTVGTAQTTYENLVSTVSQASTDTQSVDVAAVLAVTPAGYPGDDGPITQARTSLAAAKALRPTIKADVLAIRADLRVSKS